MSKKPQITVTKEFEFCYGHFLPGYSGKCRVQHGHQGKLVVTVDGIQPHTGPELAPSPYPGIVCDFHDLKACVRPIVEQLDHHNLNDLPQFHGINPTSEETVAWVVEELQKTRLGGHLVRVQFWESPSSYVEWVRPCCG